MKLPSIVDTTSFKLSALYLGLFLVSFLAIGLTVYWLTTHTLEQQLKSSIETEANRLKAEYDSGGIAELKDEIDEVDGRVSHTLLEYGVIDQNGKLIAGNLNSFKPSAGWQTVKRTPTVNKPEKEGKEFLYIRVIRLPDNVWLGVGHDGEYIQDAGEAIIQAFFMGHCNGDRFGDGWRILSEPCLPEKNRGNYLINRGHHSGRSEAPAACCKKPR